jgi:hypothetical protein
MATGIWELTKKLVLEVIKPVASESLRLTPDALLYGTGLLSLITFQTPILFLFIVTLLSLFASNMFASTMNTFMPQDTVPAKASDRCIPGLYSPTLARITLLSDLANPSGFPAMPMFVLSAVLSYCVAGVIQLSDVLNELGPDYKAKIPTVMTLSSILIIVMMIYLMVNECNGFLVVLASAAIGGLFGSLISIIIPLIFGQESINILGLPLFVKRNDKGQPLYICAVKQPTA